MPSTSPRQIPRALEEMKKIKNLLPQATIFSPDQALSFLFPPPSPAQPLRPGHLTAGPRSKSPGESFADLGTSPLPLDTPPPWLKNQSGTFPSPSSSLSLPPLPPRLNRVWARIYSMTCQCHAMHAGTQARRQTCSATPTPRGDSSNAWECERHLPEGSSNGWLLGHGS